MRGSIMKKSQVLQDGKKSNYWLVSVDLPRGEDGKRRQKRVRVRGPKREAEEVLARLLVEVAEQDGYIAPEHMTVEQYLNRWLEAQKQSVKPGVWVAQRNQIGKWKKLLGHIPLVKLTPLDLQTAIGKFPPDLSKGTRHTYFKTLRTAIRQAVSWGLLAKNPLVGVKTPSKGDKEMQIWTEEEANQFLEVARGYRHGFLFRFALATGMRQGELFALQWNDVDWKESVVHIRRSLSRPLKGEDPQYQDPKTKGSRRRIELDPSTLADLKAHRKSQLEERIRAGESWQDRNLVFCTHLGRYLSQANALDSMIRIMAKAGVRPIRFHDLRHTHATLLLAKGVNVKVVAERLGHANINITLQVYAHVLPAMQKEAVKALETLFGGPR